jgi:hypothetical protein
VRCLSCLQYKVLGLVLNNLFNMCNYYDYLILIVVIILCEYFGLVNLCNMCNCCCYLILTDVIILCEYFGSVNLFNT